jgi:hypothetical protein
MAQKASAGDIDMKIIDFTTATTKRQRAERFSRFQRHMRQVLRQLSEDMAARRRI